LKKKTSIIIVLFVLILSTIHNLLAIDIYLELKSSGRRINISLTPIDDSKLSADILKIVSADLDYSRIFNIISLLKEQQLKKEFNFTKYDRDITVRNGVDTLIKFTTKLKANKITLNSYCWDTSSAKKIFDKDYSARSDEVREISHAFSEDIIKFLTGQQMKFSSKIAFASKLSGNKEIWCTDYDGKNLTKKTNHKSICVMPKFSNDGKYIFYTTYRNGNPDIFKYDFIKDKSAPFLSYQGINLIGSVSNDGKHIIATLSKDGDPELYLFSITGNLLKRLTYSKGVDTAASFSPNAKEFVFISDRDGNPQLFIMDIDGTNLKKMTYKGYNDSPSWSPIGDKIVFTKRNGTAFDIYIIDVVTKNEVQLTKNSGSNENPSFSPEGGYILFSSNRNGKYELFTMLLNGSNQNVIVSLNKDSTNPTWSP